ncbi:hypothetical protein [Spartinivicinus poritis]|uniref:Uncharacterized protein n=1 Tax=Spartinivicinus poritis TaxID=2994640 RepID=A0ABT5UF80_9GAMM|nr:hypothetical protein [Spartinivicinus sp. A2-2]MDE1465039.1 hypothetical protein [Spartinivicinus sp. A2-2]
MESGRTMANLQDAQMGNLQATINNLLPNNNALPSSGGGGAAGLASQMVGAFSLGEGAIRRGSLPAMQMDSPGYALATIPFIDDDGVTKRMVVSGTTPDVSPRELMERIRAPANQVPVVPEGGAVRKSSLPDSWRPYALNDLSDIHKTKALNTLRDANITKYDVISMAAMGFFAARNLKNAIDNYDSSKPATKAALAQAIGFAIVVYGGMTALPISRAILKRKIHAQLLHAFLKGKDLIKHSRLARALDAADKVSIALAFAMDLMAIGISLDNAIKNPTAGNIAAVAGDILIAAVDGLALLNAIWGVGGRVGSAMAGPIGVAIVVAVMIVVAVIQGIDEAKRRVDRIYKSAGWKVYAEQAGLNIGGLLFNWLGTGKNPLFGTSAWVAENEMLTRYLGMAAKISEEELEANPECTLVVTPMQEYKVEQATTSILGIPVSAQHWLVTKTDSETTTVEPIDPSATTIDHSITINDIEKQRVNGELEPLKVGNFDDRLWVLTYNSALMNESGAKPTTLIMIGAEDTSRFQPAAEAHTIIHMRRSGVIKASGGATEVAINTRQGARGEMTENMYVWWEEGGNRKLLTIILPTDASTISVDRTDDQPNDDHLSTVFPDDNDAVDMTKIEGSILVEITNTTKEIIVYGVKRVPVSLLWKQIGSYYDESTGGYVTASGTRRGMDPNKTTEEIELGHETISNMELKPMRSRSESTLSSREPFTGENIRGKITTNTPIREFKQPVLSRNADDSSLVDLTIRRVGVFKKAGRYNASNGMAIMSPLTIVSGDEFHLTINNSYTGWEKSESTFANVVATATLNFIPSGWVIKHLTTAPGWTGIEDILPPWCQNLGLCTSERESSSLEVISEKICGGLEGRSMQECLSRIRTAWAIEHQ